MTYSMLCSDLDGTLLSTKNDVSAETITAIARIKSKMDVVLVSARMPQGITYVQDRLQITNQPIICYNGALVLHQNKTLFSTTIPIAVVKAISNTTKAHQAHLGLYAYHEWHVPCHTERVQKEIFNTKTNPTYTPTETTLSDWKNKEIGVHKIMIMGASKETVDAHQKIVSRLCKDTAHVYRSNDTLLEVTPIKASKLNAISTLLKAPNTLQSVIAFGDNYNDLEMLTGVGHGVAVANARQEVLVTIPNHTKANTAHGVAHYIEMHL